MSLFKEEFYTDDYDQEMLDFIKSKYPITKAKWDVEEGNLVYGTGNNYFWTTGMPLVTNRLTKGQFKEKIGMPVKDENVQEQNDIEDNTLTKDMLKTGMIAEYKRSVTGKIYLTMVLLGTENGDIVAGETWGSLDKSIDYITSVWQPKNNMHFLNSAEGFDAGLNLDGCTLIWERKSPEQLEIDKLQAEVDERLKRINEIKESLK